MGVGDVQNLQHTLHRPVLTERSVQGVEGNIRLQLGEHFGDIALDIDAGDAKARLFKRVAAFPSGVQTDRPLG
jgi:hypothetical protein